MNIPKIGYVLVFIFFISCNGDVGSSYKSKPNALGKMNEIVIIADEEIWESHVRDSLEYYFGGPYPIIPRPEPLFDLRHFTTRELMNEGLRQQLRTYLVVANIDDEESSTTQMVKSDLGEERLTRTRSDTVQNVSVGRDKWANGQIVIYLFGFSLDDIAEKIRIHFEGISRRVNQHDSNQLEQTTFARGENRGLIDKLFEKYGIHVRVPQEFVLAQENDRDRLVWIRKELKDGTLSLVFRKIDYTRTEQLDKEYAKRLRDDYGKIYISSPEPNSYMVTNDVDLPMFDYTIEIDGNYAREFRGIWEMENDFMGGPFISYLVLNEERSELLFIDAFVYMPGQSKRDHLQQLDFIVKNMSW